MSSNERIIMGGTVQYRRFAYLHKKDRMKNERIVGGTVQHRRFAYLHKKDRERFGLLEAVDYRDARDCLGGGCHIRQTWLTLDEEHEQAFDRYRRWKIVEAIFWDLLYRT